MKFLKFLLSFSLCLSLCEISYLVLNENNDDIVIVSLDRWEEE